MRAAASGGDRVAAASGANDGFAAVFANAASNPEMLRLLMRVMNLLELPQALFEKLPEMAAAPAAPQRPPGPRVKHPSRDELLAVVA